MQKVCPRKEGDNMTEQNGGFFAWLQDNARIILSIALVLFLLFAVYNYSQDRVDKVSKADDKSKIEEKKDEKKSKEDYNKKDKKEENSSDKQSDSKEKKDSKKKDSEKSEKKDSKKKEESKNTELAKNNDSQKKPKESNKISLSESKDTIGAKTEEPKKEEKKDDSKKSEQKKEITGKGPNVVYNDDSISVSAMKGDGLTHLARRATAEYLSHNNITDLSDGQKIYIEDYVRRSVAKRRVKPGMTFVFKLSAIKTGIEKAKALTENQKRHLSFYAKKAGI